MSTPRILSHSEVPEGNETLASPSMTGLICPNRSSQSSCSSRSSLRPGPAPPISSEVLPATISRAVSKLRTELSLAIRTANTTAIPKATPNTVARERSFSSRSRRRMNVRKRVNRDLGSGGRGDCGQGLIPLHRSDRVPNPAARTRSCHPPCAILAGWQPPSPRNGWPAAR